MGSKIFWTLCGSGTIVIEGALIATGTTPGTIRKSFACQKWKSFRKDDFQQIVEEASILKPEGKIIAADVDRKAIDIASRNAEAAGMGKVIRFKISNFKYFDAELENPFLLFNPPYGERLNAGDPEFYSMIGERLKHHYENTTAWIISTPECLKTIGLKPSKKINLLNGSINCTFRKYELYKGSKKN